MNSSMYARLAATISSIWVTSRINLVWNTGQGFPYLDKHSETPANTPVAEHIVTSLMQPFTNKGRNVTCDNFFTAKIWPSRWRGRTQLWLVHWKKLEEKFLHLQSLLLDLYMTPSYTNRVKLQLLPIKENSERTSSFWGQCIKLWQ